MPYVVYLRYTKNTKIEHTYTTQKNAAILYISQVLFLVTIPSWYISITTVSHTANVLSIARKGVETLKKNTYKVSLWPELIPENRGIFFFLVNDKNTGK